MPVLLMGVIVIIILDIDNDLKYDNFVIQTKSIILTLILISIYVNADNDINQ